MAVLDLTLSYTGSEGVTPRKGSMVTTDSLETITTAGYLNQKRNSLGNNFLPNDFIFCNYNAPTRPSQSGGDMGIFTLNFSATGVITMVDITGSAAAYVNDLEEHTVNLVETLSTTPASGTCAAQFRFSDSKGNALSTILPIMAYISTSTGAISTAGTGIAALTNGVVATIVTGRIILATCTAAGLFGLTLTASAGTYYITFMLPNGKISTSSALVVNE